MLIHFVRTGLWYPIKILGHQVPEITYVKKQYFLFGNIRLFRKIVNLFFADAVISIPERCYLLIYYINR